MKTIFISSSKNNIFVVVTNSAGELLYKDSGGVHCKRGSEKKTPKIAEKIITNIKKFISVENNEEIVLKFRNHRYTDRGRASRQIKFILKTLPFEINLKEIIDANRISKTIVRHRARRRV